MVCAEACCHGAERDQKLGSAYTNKLDYAKFFCHILTRKVSNCSYQLDTEKEADKMLVAETSHSGFLHF